MPGFSDRAGSAGHSHTATHDLAFRLDLYEVEERRERWSSSWSGSGCGLAHTYIGARGAAQDVIGALDAAAHSLSG